MNKGIISDNNENLPNFLKNKIDNFFISEDPVQVISNSEIIFFFSETKILTNGFFDTKKLFDCVESWGYCFENEIEVTNKVFIICCDVNVGDTKKISEILNPMNIDVVYVPINENFSQNNIMIGTLNPQVQTKLNQLFSVIFDNKYGVTYTQSTSSEIFNQVLSLKKHYENVLTYQISNLCTNLNLEDDEKLILKSLHSTKKEISQYDDLRVNVLQKLITNTKLNIPIQIFENLSEYLEDKLQEIQDTYTDTTTPIIIDGITFPYPKNSVNSNKIIFILELLNMGYKVIILEDESFLRDKKLVLEIQNDFLQKVEFYKRGYNPKGILIDLKL